MYFLGKKRSRKVTTFFYLITQLSNVAGSDNVAYVVKGRVVYDEDGNIDYDKSDDTIYYKVYDKDGNEVDGGTPKPIYLKTRRTEFGKVLSDVPIEGYVNKELYPQEQNNIQQAINNGQTSIEQSTPEKSVSSDEYQGVTEENDNTELDENGLPFVKTSNGVTDFGYIPEDTGLTPAPIRLSIGDERTGLQHIVDRHGEQIAKAGFGNVVDFVEYVASNYDTITEGVDTSGEPNGTYLLQAKDKHNNTLYVELSNDGSYWNINSGGVFRKGYGEKNKVVWSASEVQRGSKSATPNTLQSQDEADNQGDSNRTVSDTTSNGKGTTNNLNEQEEFYNSLPRNKKGEVDESQMSAEQKIGYAQAEFGQRTDLVRDYVAEQSKALSEKIAKLTNKTGKSVAEYKELAAMQEDKNVFVEYLSEQRQQQEQATPRRTVEEAAEADIAEAVKDIDVEPTEAQKKAGNYKKGHVKIQGFDITIENPKGAIRRGVDDNGKAWSTEMKNHYGYFKNTEGKDGDHIDVFIGDNPNSKKIFVVDQVNPNTKEFDESKVMLGFDTEDEAKKAYLSNYSKDWKGFKDITYVDIDTFRDWLYDGAKQRKPFGEYSNVRFRSIKDVNDRFNEELQQQIDGTLPKGHVYSLGIPNDILRSAGLPNLPIEMSAEMLKNKSSAKYRQHHPFDISSIKDLPRAIQNPIAVFNNPNNDGKVLLTELQYNGVNHIVAIKVRSERKSNNIEIDVNSVSTIFPKDRIEKIVEWLLDKENQGRKAYLNKEKVLTWLSDNETITRSKGYNTKDIAKVIKDFDNPTISGEKNEETRFLSDISEIKPLVDKINGGLLRLKRMDTEGVYDLLRNVAELNNMANKGYYYLNADEKLVNDKIYSLKERAVNKIAQELYNRDEYVGFDYNGVGKFDIVYFRDKQGRQISFHQYVTPEYVSDFTPIWDGITESWKDENIKFASKKNAEFEKKKHIIGKKVREKYFKEIKDSEDELERDINNAGEDVRLIMKFGTNRALSQTSIFSDKFPDIAEQRKQLENRQREVNKKLRYLRTFIHKKESVLSRSSKQDTIEKLKSEIKKIETERTELRTESRLIENKLNGIEREVSLKWRGLPEVKEATELAKIQFSLRQKRFLAERDVVEKMKSATREINDKYGDNIDEEIEKNIRVKAERDEAQQENTEKLEELITLLKNTGLGDVKTGEDFYKALAEIKEGKDIEYMRPKGTVLGFVKGNTIYLNPDEVSLNTPIHEFGHLWVSQVKEHFPDLWARGKELFLESDYLRKVQADPNYRHLDLDGQIDEAMARAIGDRGEQELDKTLLEKILDWIAEVWEKIGGVFGIDNLTSEQISNLTLQDFTDMATSELLSGQNLTERVNGNRGGATRYNTADETADIKARAIADGTFMKAPNGKDTNLTERQWLQVRTKAFKKWFGDWENAYKLELIENLQPIGVDNKGLSRERAEEEYKKIGTSKTNRYDNRRIEFVNNAFGKIARHKNSALILDIIPQLNDLFESAIPIYFEEEREPLKSTNIVGSHNYLGKVRVNDEDYYVRITAQELTPSWKQNEKQGKSNFHNMAVSDIAIYDESGSSVTAKDYSIDNDNRNRFVDAKLQHFFETAREARENSSKVVDENGEPMVVYHGSGVNNITTFYDGGMFFARDIEVAKGYAGENGVVYQSFLKLTNPLIENAAYNNWNDLRPELEDYKRYRIIDHDGDIVMDDIKYEQDAETYALDMAYEEASYNDNDVDLDDITPYEYESYYDNENITTNDFWSFAIEKGYDGVIIKNITDSVDEETFFHTDVFITSSPAQIKSATDNIGTFNEEDEDIRYMLVNVQDEKAIDEERRRPKFEIKGEDVYTTMYTTRADTETEIDVLYNGNDFEKALSKAEGYNEDSDREDLKVSVEAMRLKIPITAIKEEYDYDDEEYDGYVAPFVEDYIDDFVEDVDYDRYETGRDMFDVYKSKPDTDEHELIGTITDKLQQQTGLYIGKYSTFYITKNGEMTDEEADKDGELNAFVSMRIADHTHNRHNGDSTLNIVIADDDPTKTKFQSSKEDLRYTTKDNAEEIVKDILDFWRQYAREYFGDINKQFNDDLDEFERNRLLSSRKFNLGRPSPILMAAGLNGVSIQMTQSVLSKHLDKHNLKTDDLRELPEAIRTPIMVYEWGDKARNSVIVTSIPRGEERITTTIRLTRDGNKLNVNEISSIYGKSVERLIRDINTPKSEFGKDNLRYVDKKQVLDWFAMEAPKASSQTQQELITATKIIENFENPPINEKKVIDDTTNDMVRYSIKASEQLDKEDEVMGETKSPQTKGFWFCDPEGIRTPDPQLRRLLLYPAELPDLYTILS